MADPAGKPRLLLVDGHNLIHAWPDLASLQKARPGGGSARDALTRDLIAFADASEWSVAVVYDGQGKSTELSDAESVKGVQVFYSARGTTADEVIERFARSYTARFDITVVTGDGGVRAAVSAANCDWMSADAFDQMLDTERQALSDRIRRRNES